MDVNGSGLFHTGDTGISEHVCYHPDVYATILITMNHKPVLWLILIRDKAQLFQNDIVVQLSKLNEFADKWCTDSGDPTTFEAHELAALRP